MCSSFYKYVNGSCITDKSKSLGKHCRSGGDCRGQGEFCSSFSICMCLSTHVDVGSQCKPVIYPGQFGCEDSLQCSKGFPGAECDVSRTCVCPHGMFVSQQTCVTSDIHTAQSSLINDMMLHNVLMADHRMINKSDFKGNFYRRKGYDTSRTYLIEPDGICSYDNQCAGYPLSICDGVCKCVQGSLNTGTTCISSSTALQSSISCPAGQTYIREAGVCMTAQHPGEPCQYSQQCSALEPGAYCLKMRCECVYGMKKSSNGCTFVNNDCKERGHIFISETGECKKVIPPGGKGCSHNLQCSGAYPDATCFMQTCTCPPNLPVAVDGTCGRSCPEGKVYSGVTGECLPEVQPGDVCLYSSQCQSVFGGMVCDKNICRCPNGLMFDGSKCSQTCPPHRRLIQKDICVDACSGDTIEANGRCLSMVEIGQPCTTSSQCRHGSFCQNGACLCPPGFFVVDNQCQAVESDPNGSCANNEKCTKGSVCYNGRCTCPRNQELVGGRCQPTRAAVRAYNNALTNIKRIRLKFASQPRLNETDRTNNVPIGSACVRVGVNCDGGSVCVAGFCVCPLGKTPRNGICVKHVIALPGASCEQGEECSENSYCNEQTSICECASSSQMVVGNRCVERLRSHPGYGCSMGEMCVGNSICINEKCQCPQGKVEVNKICVDLLKVNVGDNCGKGMACGGGSYCNQETSTCTCPKGQKEIKGECKQVQLVYPGERCHEVTNRCAGGSYCVRGRCECPYNMHIVDRKCALQPQAAPGEPCNENIVCTGSSVCRNGVCSCLNDMVIKEKICVQRRKVSVGSTCDKYDICTGNSKCQDSRCQCPVGHVVSNDVCVQRKTVTPGYLCNPEDICIGQSVCIRGVCQCKPDYKQMHNICVKANQGHEGSTCSIREDCSDNLACVEGKCSCPDGQFSVGGRCRSYIALGNTCGTEDRCAGDNVYCFDDRCTCKHGYAISNNECIKSIVVPNEPETPSQVRSGLIGHFCSTDDECKVAHSACLRSVCMCKMGYRIFGSTQCIPRLKKEELKSIEIKRPTMVNIGDKCDQTSICQKGAICAKGICECPEGFAEANGACTAINPKIRVIVPPLSSCARGEICSGNSECVHGMCFCQEEFTLYHGKCQPLKKVEKMRIIESKGRVSQTTTSAPITTATTTPTTSTTTTTTTTTTTEALVQKFIETTSTPSITPIKILMKLTTPPTSTTTPVTPFWFKIVKPGHPCDSSSYCTNCSVCISGFCVCPEGLEIHGERCVSHIDAQKCVASNQCPSGANCVRGECLCKPGLGLSRLGFCIPINYADPGTSCSHGEKCRGDSHCVDGFCVCQDPLILRENRCVPTSREKRYISDTFHKMVKFTPRKKAKLGEFCSKNEQCAKQTICDNGLCTCSKNLLQSGFECVPKLSVITVIVGPGDSCRGAFCTGGSVCTNLICRCPDGYYKLNEKCAKKEARIGAPCSLTTRCSGGSECVSSYCQCPDKYNADLDECYPNDQPKKSVKSFPTKKSQSGQVISASAVNCPIGYELVNGMCVNNENLSIIQLAEPGDSCEDGRILCTGNSVCANNICICPGGEVIRNNTCITVNSYSAPGEVCDVEDTICTGNSICLDGICKCPSNQGALNGKCTNMGVMICIPSQCGVNQICINNQCNCKEGFYSPNGDCPGSNCNCVARISTNPTCIGNGCKLSAIPSPFFGMPGQMCDMRPGAIPCRNQAVCVNNFCACPSNRVISGNNCVQYMGDALPGQSCSAEGIICRGGSTCYQNICQCDPGLIPIQEKCTIQIRITINPRFFVTTQPSIFDLLPGQPCDPSCSFQPCLQRCSGGSSCIASICTCPTGSYVFNNLCTPVVDNNNYTRTARPGDFCDNQIVCIGGSSCIIGTCACDSGYTPSADRTSCVLIDRYGVRSRSYPTSYCTFDTDCSNGSICVDKRCTCRVGDEMVNGKCQTANQPGSRCHTSYCSNEAECYNGYCVCAKTHFSNATLHCVPNHETMNKLIYPGSKCDKSQICLNNSKCLLGFCVFPSDTSDQSLGLLDPSSRNAHNQKSTVPVSPGFLKKCPTDGSCRLPNCYCTPPDNSTPQNIPVKQIPQMVMLTFDDPITDRIINTLKSIFNGKIRNPNGCAIKGTFFISHQWNNYDQCQWLYSKGNELAVNSITREDLSNRTKERWMREQKGMRDTLTEFSYAEKSHIIGARAPNFKIGGDIQMSMLSENGFAYDNSMIVNGQYWPQTLDYKPSWECEPPQKCPQKIHRGIWQIPIQTVQGNDGYWYSTMDRAIKPSDSRLSVKQMLMRNFLTNYKSNRAPFVLTLSTDFLTYLPDNGAIYALQDFLSEIVQRQDVYVVTGSQIIDWMQKPTEIANLRNIKSWQCSFFMNDHIQPCESPSVCSYSGRSGNHVAHKEISIRFADGNSTKSERDLAKFLLADYYQYTRPVKNYSSVLNVTVQPQIYNLVEVNEQNEQIKILLWFPQSWQDDYLRWNPKEWSGIEKIIIPKSQIWIPDGYIFNTVEEQEPLENHNARVRFDGRVEVDFNKLVDLTCPMSVLSFPFDVQLCALQFGSWSYQAHAISFNVLDTFVPKNSKNSEWDIVSFNATKIVTKYEDTLGGYNVYEEIFYYLELRRKPLYYIVVILLPSFLIVTISNIGLFTPHGVHGDREEHVSLGLTTMLTMAVILDMVTGQMPRSSEGIPLLGMYVLIEFVISVIAVLVSVVIIFAHERMLYLEATPPYWVQRLFSNDKICVEEIEEDFCSKPSDMIQELRFCMDEIRKYIDDQESSERVRIIWQRFFSWADILFSIFFFVVNCLVTFYMFMEFMF
ncbi:unnamed protein product [Caenorhabditis bovis]|uniref:EGF-like domain-containing protein n=1 Tax=Caenorhabditis bovis TaxID=2654633 RepID=A0A8S1E635_9PELO|nr:unnamed protein product [Caenorhabditis bovis]